MRPGVSTRFLFLPASVLVVVAVIALSFSAHAHADSVALYATSCLGGWENSAYATGMPDVRDVDASVLFSESNSAVLRPNTQTQLYCGGFTGDVIENTVPVDIRVTFSWDAEFPADVSSKPAASESVPESFLPSVETAPDTVPEVAPTTELVPEATSAEPVDESAPASDVVSEPELAPVPESVQEPTSWLWRVLGTVVFAQEVSGGEQENTEAISETVSNEELTDVPAPALIEENTTVTADDTVSTEVAPYGIVEVLYTLNGVEWKSLGYVRKNDFSRTSFEIPVTEASDWEGISQIQIEVRTVPTMNQVDPTIYLDAVWLEVEYEGAVNAETDRVPDIYAMPTDFPDINTATVHAFRGFNDRVATIVERDAIPALFVGHRIENGYTIEQVSTVARAIIKYLVLPPRGATQPVLARPQSHHVSMFQVHLFQPMLSVFLPTPQVAPKQIPTIM